MSATTDLDLVRLFVMVADQGSFSEAARRLGVPKSSVSRGVARLERELGTQLLHRTTQTVGLTTAGGAFHERVAPLVSALTEAIATMPDRGETPSGVLRITAANDFGAVVLGELVPRYLARHPGVTADIWLTNAVVDLVGDGFDLALRISTGPMKDSSLVARKLASIEMQFFASPSYLARAGQPRSVEELAHHDWVQARQWIGRRDLPRFARPPHIVADDFAFIRHALGAGAGVGALPSFIAQEDVARGLLARVVPKFAIDSGTLYLVHPPLQHVPAKVRSFRAFLQEQLGSRMLAL